MSDIRYPINSIVMAYDGRIGIVRAHYLYTPPASVMSVEPCWMTIIECHHRVWHYRSSQITGIVTYPDTPPIRVVTGGRDCMPVAIAAGAAAQLHGHPGGDPHNPGPEAA